MNAGRVQMLVIIGESNPVQTAPADLNFADAMSKVQTRFHSGLFLDETATLCHWHVPAAHFLEAWSDARTRRRHGDDRAAADSADVRRQVGARSACRRCSSARSATATTSCARYWMAQPHGAERSRARVRQRAARAACRAAGAAGATGALQVQRRRSPTGDARWRSDGGAGATGDAERAPQVTPGQQAGASARGNQPRNRTSPRWWPCKPPRRR